MDNFQALYSFEFEWALDSLPLTERALAFASLAHSGQMRKWTGAPYLSHVMRVASRVRWWGLGDEAVAAAYLHDVVEDCGVSLDLIGKTFGDSVARLVSEMTNVSKATHPRDDQRSERKRLDRERLAGVSRIAKTIKLADRVDNLGETSGANKSFMAMYAEESALLLEVLKGTNVALEEELARLIDLARRKSKS